MMEQLRGLCFVFQQVWTRMPMSGDKMTQQINDMHASLLRLTDLVYNVDNTTATLSAPWGNAQPWRFFYARFKGGLNG